MKHLNKLIALLLSMLIVVACFALAAAAEEKTELPYVSDGLVACYNAFGIEKGTSSWADLSGNGNDIAGMPDNEANYFGNDAYHLNSIKINFPEAITNCVNGEEFTVEMQLGDLEAIATGFNTFINCPNDWFSLFIRVPGDYIEFKGNTNSRPKETGGHDYFENSTVAVVFKLGETTKVYVDGVLAAESPSASTTKLGADAMFFGHASYNYSTDFKAMRFYSKALTEAQVKANSDADKEYGKKPAEPLEYEDEIAAKVGSKIDDPKFDVVVNAEMGKDNKKVTVTISFENLKEELTGFVTKLNYDAERLTLVTESKADHSLDLGINGFGDKWENLCKKNDEDGVIDLQMIVADDLTQVMKAGNTYTLTIEFELKEGFDKAGVWVANGNNIKGMMTGFKSCQGSGSYDIAEKGEDVTSTEETTSESSSEVSSEVSTEASEQSKDVQPGDSGIIFFAIIGVLAITGAVVACKARR